MNGDSKALPDLLLEKYLLGELSTDQLNRVEQHLKSDKKSTRRLEELKISNREILEKYPPDKIARQINDKLEYLIKKQSHERRSNRGLFKILTVATSTIAAIIAFLIIVPVAFQTQKNELTQGAETTRIKGSNPAISEHKPGIMVYIKKQNSIDVLVNGAKVQEHDVIQLAYKAEGRKYGLIFSIDGRGALTMHYPLDEDNVAELNPGREVYLSSSYELDDAPLFERFFFITSQDTFPAENIIEEAEVLASNPENAIKDELSLPKNLEQTSFILIKEEKNNEN